MKDRTAGRLPWALASACAVCVALASAITIADPAHTSDVATVISYIGVAPLALIGALIASRRPRNPDRMAPDHLGAGARPESIEGDV